MPTNGNLEKLNFPRTLECSKNFNWSYKFGLGSIQAKFYFCDFQFFYILSTLGKHEKHNLVECGRTITI